MKRFLLPLIFATVMLVTVAGIGIVVVKYALELTTQARPFSYEEMEKLQETNKLADSDIPRLLACFERNDEDLRVKASETLAQLGGKAVDPLRAKLKHHNARVRYCAVQTLALMKTDAVSAAPDLIVCTSDIDPEVRRKAVYALGRIGPAEGTFAAIVKGLDDNDLSVVEAAFAELEKMDAPSRDALPTLVKLARSSNFQTSSEAFKLLGKMGAPAAPALKDLFKSAKPTERGIIIQAAVPLGAAAKPLLPELQTHLETTTWWDHEADIFAICKACGPDGASALTNVLKSLHDPKSPHFAIADDRAKTLVRVLGQFGAQAKDATPTLATLLKDRESLQIAILETLGDIGPSAKDAVPAVQALTADPRVGAAARAALKRMGVREEK